MANSIGDLSIDSTGGAYSKYSNTVVDTNKGDEATSYMDFESYLKVLAAQMSNQDFNDPMKDSEMLQQMASYSMLEGIKNMTAQSNISYATSLVGKAVTVNDGKDYDTGIVESVVVVDSKPYLVVNGFKYEASTVSNVTSADIYNLLSRLIDQKVDIHGKNEDGEDEITGSGTVTNVLMLDGQAYVIVDGKDRIPLKDISLQKAENEGSEGTGEEAKPSEESGEAGEATESTTEVTEGTAEAQSYAASAVSANTPAATSYIAQSDALFSELMSTIDSISGANTDDISISTGMTPNLDGYETVTVTTLDVPNYAAAFMAEYEELTGYIQQSPVLSDGISYVTSGNQTADEQSAGYNDTYTNYTNTSSSGNLTAGMYDVALNASTFGAVARSGNLTPTLSNAQVYDIIRSGEYSSRYSQKYGLELYSDSKPGISNSDCKPHRYKPEQYPEEAALADALGTRMYDVRFIHNQAITSRIDTSKVIGKTISGREVCEIGYCGKGRLGEVITFKDGKQRVEILFDNGNSGWLETSGKYTLDQIINQQVGDDVTPFEISIAMYATSTSAKKFENLRQSLLSMGVNVVG